MTWRPNRVRSVIALAAHPDDIEIGSAATLMLLADANPDASFTFVCASGGDGPRAEEATESASHLLGERASLRIGEWPDTLLPYRDPEGLKRWLVQTTSEIEPDLVLAPTLHDRHQDHRFIAELAWQLFRRADILEYEIPKWEGDRPTANLLVPISPELADRKLNHLERHFPSQHDKPWYRRELFAATMCLRGVEAGVDHAEAFVARKIVWDATATM